MLKVLFAFFNAMSLSNSTQDYLSKVLAAPANDKKKSSVSGTTSMKHKSSLSSKKAKKHIFTSLFII